MTAANETVATVRHLLRTDYLTFAQKAFETAAGEELSDDPYIKVICKAGLDVYEGKIRRLVLNMPPRHGKTLLFTVSLTAWELAHRPAAKVAIVCYSEGLSRFISDRVRDVMTSAWFLETFSTRLRDGRNKAMDFETTAGGRVFANHLGPGLTGHGAGLFIIDDPADIGDAEAPHRLAEANNIFDRRVRNRLNHPGSDRIVIVGHRIHPVDLSGHVLREGGWTHVKLPLVAERDDTYVTPFGVWNRGKGEFLRAAEYTDASVEVLRRLATIPDFPTFYQQSPAEPGWQISADDFPLFDVVPAGAGGVVLSIDAGHVPGERNSFSVILAWRSTGPDHFLVDQWRERVVPSDLERAVRTFINRHRPRFVLIETASAGISLLSTLERRARREGFVLVPISTENRSKSARFSDVLPTIKEHRVHLANKPWTTNCIEELTTFPGCPNDDQVDATAQYLAWAAEHPVVELSRPRAMGTAAMRGMRFVSGKSRNPLVRSRSPYIYGPKR